jgi:hypothetical protein
MAKTTATIDVNVNLSLTDSTAIMFLQLLENYCNDNALYVNSDFKNLNGDIQLTFVDNKLNRKRK